MRDDNWLSEAPLDEWHGVNSDYRGRVIELHLHSNGLSGEIPPELGNLSYLIYLTLSENQLSGEIPPELGNLSYLETLFLRGNQLSGKIPPELGNLSNLEILNLAQNQLSGLVPSELGNLRNISILRFTGNRQLTTHISQDVLTSPPPTWIFTEDIPEEHRTIFREQMEHVRSYFSDRFGVEATGFTVIVGENYEAMAPEYERITGKSLSLHYRPNQRDQHAWVIDSVSGSAVLGMMYGQTYFADFAKSLDYHEHIIAHEYFHVLQGQMAAGFRLLDDGDIAWGFMLERGPTWLVEGLASYADYAYTPTRPGLRPFLNDRYQPYHTLAIERAVAPPDVIKDSLTQELANIEAYSAFRNCDVGEHSYALSFIAATFLVEEVVEHEKSYVDYWKLLGEQATWQQSFEEAFGLSVEAFYAAFDEWTLSRDAPIPTMVRFKVQLDWPDRSASSDGILRVGIDWQGTPIRHAAWRSRAILVRGEQDASILYVVYPEGATGSGSFSLWSEEGCSRYLLGYYKDGEVVAEREEATLIEFTGVSEDLDWTIPVNSGSLPRILCQGCCLGISGES